MISLKKRFLFIHVPKTGGNSIQNILKSYSEDEIVILADHQDGVERFGVRNSRYNITKHSRLSEYQSVLDAITYRSLFKFATIRNPWDRMISLYFSPHRGIKEWHRGDFLRLVDNALTLRGYICENTVSTGFFFSPGSQETRATKKLDSDVDFLVKFEQLDHDFRIVCRILNIPYCALPKRNSSIRAHYSRYYDGELKEIVGKKFAEEIELGDYSFHDS